jgi:Xaa-Pro aminopeptidase
MFSTLTYTERRSKLKKLINKGIALFPGNGESSMNYRGNTYRFRQDSSFLYFFGLNEPGLVALIDFETGDETLFGNDLEIDDIIWTGDLPTMSQKARIAGVSKNMPLSKLPEILAEAQAKKRTIHFLPPYRDERRLELQRWLGIPADKLAQLVSTQLISAVVSLRSVKEEAEIIDMENTLSTVTFPMYAKARQMAVAGTKESDIAGAMEGIALASEGTVAFPIICSNRGQILHNHSHSNTLKKGDLLLIDAGAESPMGYATDITRTLPIGPFSPKQKDIYQIVLNTQLAAIASIKPGILYCDVHQIAASVITDGLIALGLMKGNLDEAVNAGAHALFFPHGIGHMLGLDVHDMEDLGEDFVGYDHETTRSPQFGTAYLRMARRLQAGFIVTVEPGIYFIPQLIDLWKKDKIHEQFINYTKVEEYRTFGGIRIEDDVLVTPTSQRVLGRPIPKSIPEVV